MHYYSNQNCEIVSKCELKTWRNFEFIFEIQINSSKTDVDMFK